MEKNISNPLLQTVYRRQLVIQISDIKIYEGNATDYAVHGEAWRNLFVITVGQQR